MVFGVVAEWVPVCGRGSLLLLLLQYSVHLGLLHLAPTSAEEWVSSATLVLGDGVGALQHQKPVQKYHQWATGALCRCFNGSALSARRVLLQSISRNTAPPSSPVFSS